MAGGKIGPAGGLQHFESSSPDSATVNFIGSRNDGTVVSWGYPTGGAWVAAGSTKDVSNYGGLNVDAASHYDDTTIYSQRFIKKECDVRFNVIYGGMYPITYGANTYAQCGTQTTSATYAGSSDPWQGLFSIVSIGAMGEHTVCLSNVGNIACWGRNDYSQCGCTGNPVYNAIQPDIPGPFLMATAGRDFTVAIRQDGTLWAMGRNDVGQCGIIGVDPVTTLTQVGTDDFWKEVHCGTDHTLLLTTHGQLHGMGGNAFGQLGLGHYNDQPTPIRLTGYLFTCVSAGHYFSVGWAVDNEWYGWGSNSHGQLSILPSIGGTYNTPTLGTVDLINTIHPHPSPDPNELVVAQIATGKYHTLCITGERWGQIVYACGDNTYGQCANTIVGGGNIPTIQQCTSICGSFSYPVGSVIRSDYCSGAGYDIWETINCGSYHSIVVPSTYVCGVYAIGKNDKGQCSPDIISANTGGEWYHSTDPNTSGVWKSSAAAGNDYTVALINE